MRNTVFIGMACVFVSACGVDVAERVHVVDSPVDTSDGLPVEGTTVLNVIPPRLTRFEATAPKTPSNEGNRVQEAQAAQGASRRIVSSSPEFKLGPGRLPRRPRTTQVIGFRKLKRLRRRPTVSRFLQRTSKKA